MKRIIEIDDRDAVSDSLRDIRLFISGMYISPDKSFVSDDIKKCLSEYYRTNDPIVESAYKKILASAVIKSCNDDQDIPPKFKKKVAERMVNEFLQCCEASKETYCSACSTGRYKGLAPGTDASNAVRKRAAEEYSVVRTVQRAQKLKELVKRVGVNTAITVFKNTGSKFLTGVATVASVLTDIIIPEPIKEKIKNKAKEIGKYVSATVDSTITTVKSKLNDTKVGREIVTTIEKADTMIQEVATGIKKVAIKAATITKSFFSSGWKKLKSAFA